MNLKQMSFFCAVVEAGNANAAALKLFISPTAISMQISQLEATLGGKLFDRASRPMTLTSLGEFFYPKAKALLSGVNRLHEEAKGIASGNLGWLSIGFTRSTIFSVIPDAVRAMKTELPQVQIDIVEMLTEHQIQGIRNGVIHIGISRVLSAMTYEPDMAYTPLFKDPLVAAIPKNHVLASHQSISALDFNDIPFISYPKDPHSSFAKLSIGLLEAAGARPKVGFEAKEIHTALGLVAAGLGATLVGKSVTANNRADVKFLPLSDTKVEATLFAVRKKNEQYQLADVFLDIIKKQSLKRR